MSKYLLVLVGVILVIATNVSAQQCVDWSETISRPARYPEIKGNVCEIQNHLCIVAGDSLKVVDISDIENAVVLGEVALPSMATKIKILRQRAYVLCDSDGVAEIDFSDPRNPVIWRRYLPGVSFSDIAVTPSTVVVREEDGGEIHGLIVGQGGELVAESIDLGSTVESIVGIGAIDDMLIYVSKYSFRLYDLSVLSDPRLLVSPLDNEIEYLSSMTVVDRRVYLTGWRYGPGGYDMEAVSIILLVDEYGLTEPISGRTNTTCAIWGVDEQLLLSDGNWSFVLHDMDESADLVSQYVGFRSDFAIARERIVAVAMNEGMVLWDSTIRPSASLVIFDEDGTVIGASGGYRITKYQNTIYYGVGGGYSTSTRLQLHDISSALEPALLHTIWNYDGVWSGSSLLDVRGGSIRDDWFTIHTYAPYDCSLVAFFRMSDGESVDRIFGKGTVAHANEFWHWGVYGFDSHICRYEFDVMNGLALVGQYELGDFGHSIFGISSPEPGILLVSKRDNFDVYDSTDPEQLVRLASYLKQPSLEVNAVWSDERMVYPDGDKIISIDFSNRSAPEIVDEIVMEDSIKSISMTRRIISVVHGAGVQLLRLESDGQLTECSEVVLGEFTDITWSGSAAYISSGSGVQLYDFVDPWHPSWVGQMGTSANRVDQVGGYLVADTSVYPMHCTYWASTPDSPATVLSQNRPNPFNPITSIPYSLAQRDRVSLKVFDLRGRLISTLVDGIMPAGDHIATWQPSKSARDAIPTGVYLYQLKTSEGKKTGKMTLVR